MTENDTILTFNPTLKLPDDENSFSVNIRNKGTIDAMISEIIDTSLTPEQEKYATCSVGYYDGTEIKEKDKIAAGEVLPLKITVTYKEDLTADDLPSELTLSNLSLSIEYVPADETAKQANIELSFANEPWSRISYDVQNGLAKYYKLGETKKIDMGELGIHSVRVANNTTPEECSTEGFSQSACGFVVEFADVINKHAMNSTNTNAGGWRDSAMRTYLNDDIYNSLPEELREVIVVTTITTVSEVDKTPDYVTNDKLYLLAQKELTNYEYDDTKTKQLDYYMEQGVTSSNNLNLLSKSLNEKVTSWYLRSTRTYSLSGNNKFFTVYSNQIDDAQASSEQGVSPAFRIG